MTDLNDLFTDLNPDNKQFIGKKAQDMTKNILSNLDLTAHSASDILSALRDNGINITIPSFYSLYNDATGKSERAQKIKYVNQQYVPKDSLLEPALYPLKTRYRIVQSIKYEDLDTGVVFNREFVVDTNILQSIGEMQQTAIEAFESRYNYSVIEIHTIRGYIYEG